MFREIIIITSILAAKLCHVSVNAENAVKRNKFHKKHVPDLRSEAKFNSDLSQDEEYEDLQDELQAYRSTLAKLSSAVARNAMINKKPCLRMGGVCINYKQCSGFRFLADVPGCHDSLNVCCFAQERKIMKKYKKPYNHKRLVPKTYQRKFSGKGIKEKGKTIPLVSQRVHQNRNINPKKTLADFKDDGDIDTNKIETTQESHSDDPNSLSVSNEETIIKRRKRPEASEDLSALSKNGNSISLIVKTT